VPKKASSTKLPQNGPHVAHVQADLARMTDLDGVVGFLRTAHNLTWAALKAKFEVVVTSAAARRSVMDRATALLLSLGTDKHLARQPILEAIVLWW
jgi:quinolinate synthase